MTNKIKHLICGRSCAATTLLVFWSISALSVAEDQLKTNNTASSQPPVLHVGKCQDFEFDGSDTHWGRAQWVELSQRPDGKHDYESRFKMLYSETGVYVLFDGKDKVLTATITKDFEDLWLEDVYECFFWTDEQHTIYFEYEISPLGYELPIIIPNMDGTFLGWRPWHYDGERKTRKLVTPAGGDGKSMAKVDGWRAEVFIPYALLSPLKNVPPKPGTQWRANFYRVDYDGGSTTSWDWARVGPSFHEFRKFGTIVFD